MNILGWTDHLAAGVTAEALAKRIRSVLLMAPGEFLDVTRRAREVWEGEFAPERFRAVLSRIVAALRRPHAGLA